MDPGDPARLFDSPSEPADLRAALAAAVADLGSDQQIARLAKRLSPLLGIGAAGAAVTATAGSGVVKGAATGVALKAGAVALALIAAGGGAWFSSTSQQAPPPAPTSVAVRAARQPTSPSPAQAAPIVVGEAPTAEATTATPSLQKGAPPSKPAPVVAVPVAPVMASAAPAAASIAPVVASTEGELLEQARSVLKSDPAAALSRANEAASLFPHGLLVQEREVIAIQALRELGRSAEADQRAAAFSAAFPGSAFQRKLDAIP